MLGGNRAILRRVVPAVIAVGLAAAGVVFALSADRDTVGRASGDTAGRTATTGPSGTGGSGGATHPISTAAASSCGAASAQTIAAVQAKVARGIYDSELSGMETRLDVGRIVTNGPLLSALASNQTGAVQSAVHAIVYQPHWHIVRLRVTSGSRVLADVGGPDIIAPVSGTLRSKGRTLGRYVMSVQDDAGYMKLVTRFTGAPINIYRNGSFVMGTLQPTPAAGAGPTVKVGGRSYLTVPIQATAFPSGPLKAVLYVPTSLGALAGKSCQAVRVAAWGSVLMHIAARLKPLQTHYQALAELIRAVTGGHVYVRSGKRQIAGGAVPAKIPAHGSVAYAGRVWPVFSWEPVAAQRIYFLTPPA